MNLLVDVGNSRVKWCSHSGGRLLDMSEASHRHSDIGAIARSEWSTLGSPAHLVIANVAGADTESALSCVAGELWGVAPTFIRSARESFGVVSAYSEAERLGVDRWVAMIGARKLAPGALGIVDCGTAITLDFVDASGKHRGGLILPGVLLMRRSLASSTGDLPMAAGKFAKVLATDTVEAISAGTLNAAAWSIRMFRREIENQTDSRITWFLTGGGSASLLSLLDSEFRHHPHLVLEGLAVFDAAESN